MTWYKCAYTVVALCVPELCKRDALPEWGWHNVAYYIAWHTRSHVYLVFSKAHNLSTIPAEQWFRLPLSLVMTAVAVVVVVNVPLFTLARSLLLCALTLNVFNYDTSIVSLFDVCLLQCTLIFATFNGANTWHTSHLKAINPKSKLSPRQNATWRT